MSREEEVAHEIDEFLETVDTAVIANQVFVDADILMRIYAEYMAVIQELIEETGIEDPDNHPVVQGQSMVLNGLMFMYQGLIRKHANDIKVDPARLDRELRDLLDE